MEYLYDALTHMMTLPIKVFHYQIIKRHPELLHEPGSIVLEELRSKAIKCISSSSLKALSRLYALKDLLERCRSMGVLRGIFGAGETKILPQMLKYPADIEKRLYDIFATDQSRDIDERISYIEGILLRLDINYHRLLWIELHQHIALLLLQRLDRTQTQSFDDAIRLCNLILQWCPVTFSPYIWADVKEIHAYALQNIQIGIRVENIEKSLAILNDILMVRTKGSLPLEWARTMILLGNGYQIRQQGSPSENLDAAIKAYHDALTVFTRETMPYEWVSGMISLGSIYIYHPKQGRPEDLELGISIFEKILTVLTPEMDANEYARALFCIGEAYQKWQAGDLANIRERSIRAYHTALKVCPKETAPVNWARIKSRLATAYTKRLIGDRAENIEIAIALYQEALEIRDRRTMQVDWASTTNDLANAYYFRERGERADNIEKAIELYHKTLTVRTLRSTPDDWASTMHNLGVAYRERNYGSRKENLLKAIECFNNALNVRQRDSAPDHWVYTKYNLILANYAYHQKSPDITAQCIDELEECLGVLARFVFPIRRINMLRDLADLLMANENWEKAAAVFEEIHEINIILKARELTVESQSDRIRRTDKIYAAAAYCYDRLGRFDQSICWLERGKTQVLRDRTAKDQALFHKLRHEDSMQYRMILKKLSFLNAQIDRTDYFVHISDMIKQAQNELTALTAHIRQYLPDFLSSGMDYSNIKNLLAIDGAKAFIIFNITSYGSSVSILAGKPDDPIERTFFLNHFTEMSLKEILERWGNAHRVLANEFRTCSGITDLDFGRSVEIKECAILAWQNTVTKLLQELYAMLFVPIRHVLETLKPKQLVLITHHALHILPLYLIPLAGYGKKQYLIDFYEVIQAPSFHFLQSAHPSSGSSYRSFMGIGNPIGDLPGADLEIEIASTFFREAEIIAGENATISVIKKKAPAFDILHLACHGVPDLIDINNSYLLLAAENTEQRPISRREETREGSIRRSSDGLPLQITRGAGNGEIETIFYDSAGHVHTHLIKYEDGHMYLLSPVSNTHPRVILGEAWTLHDILRNLTLNETKLVVLAACESGPIILGALPDEYMSLSAGFLAAGVSTVVHTLWAVDDWSTYLLMRQFYHYLINEHLSPIHSLRKAQRYLRSIPGYESFFYWGAFQVSGSSDS